MSDYANKKFWLRAFDRAVATAGQSALAVFTAGATGIMEIDGFQLLSVTGLAVAASIATSVAYPGRILEGKKDEVSKEEILDQILEEVEKPSEYVPKHRKEGKHAL